MNYEELKRIKPAKATRVITTPDGEQLLTCPLDELRAGDIVRVQASERIPADGIVIAGSSRVGNHYDIISSTITTKQPNDEVQACTLNCDAPLDVLLTTSHEESTYSHHLENLMEAQPKAKKILALFSSLRDNKVAL